MGKQSRINSRRTAVGTENIKPHSWTKGQSGNPAGRPVGARNRAKIIAEWLDCDADDGAPGTKADQLVRALILKAQAGDVVAFKMVFDSVFGKAPDVFQSEDFNNEWKIEIVHKKLKGDADAS